MYEVGVTSYVFDALRVLVGGGIFKLFIWDMFLKDYFDDSIDNLRKTADCCREAKANDAANNTSESRAGDNELSSDRCGRVEDTDVQSVATGIVSGGNRILPE